VSRKSMQLANRVRIDSGELPPSLDRHVADGRIILSDGVHFIQSMLATQLNNYVEDKSLDKNVVIKLTQYVTNAVQGRKSVASPIYREGKRTRTDVRLIIILGIEIQEWKGDKIGNPSNFEQAATSAAAAASGPAAPAANRPAPARAAGGGGAAGRSGKDMGPIFPIEGLSPYQNK